MKAILFLGTSLVSAQYIKKATKKLGFQPIFLLKIADYSGDPKQAIELCEHYEADINSLKDIERVIQQHNLASRCIAITSLLDETLQYACVIAQKYKLIGPDPTLSKLTDKTYVQQIISEFSPPSITFDLSNLSDKKITSFIEENNNFNEFLLKPAISSGAVDIFILDKEINADLIKNIIIKQTQINASKFHRWMLQSRINGRLYSLEGFVKDGHINFLGFSRRVRKELTECINEFPVDEDLTDNLKQQCMQAVAALIQRSNYRNGYFHSEFIIKNLNAYFIDANMGRIAGGAFIHRLSKYYEIDATDIITHVIDLGLFKGEHTKSFQYKEKHQGRTLTINYCLSESALVWNVTLPSQTTSFHTVVANNGKVIPAIGFNDCAWVGFLAGFKEDVLTEIDHIIINTNKGPMRPFYVLFEEEREVIEPVKKINHD